MNKLVVVCAVIVLFGVGYARAGTWTTLPVYSPVGIDGSNVLGGNQIYNLTTGSWISIPNVPGYDTYANGISGSTIVGQGFGNDHMSGFIYNGTSYIAHNLNYPNTYYTVACGISGNNIAGWYEDNTGGIHGLVCNIGNASYWMGDIYGATYNAINYPGATYTFARGISGNNIVGYYTDSVGSPYGFLYNLITQNSTALPIIANGIDGSNVVGGDQLYNLTTGSLTTLDYPGAIYTVATAISGNNIVGQYEDISGYYHGFLYTIPEPTTLLLLGLGGLIARRHRK